MAVVLSPRLMPPSCRVRERLGMEWLNLQLLHLGGGSKVEWLDFMADTADLVNETRACNILPPSSAIPPSPDASMGADTSPDAICGTKLLYIMGQ